MRLCVASTFRDASGYLDRYLAQAADLVGAAEARGDTVEFLWGENDSVDDTRARLQQVRGHVVVVECHTGAPYYQSHEDHAARWRNVARFSNQILDALPADFDVLVWVESDLMWEPRTLLALADSAAVLGAVAAPMWKQDGRFYDTWTTRLNGETFIPPEGAGLVAVDSAAGCLAFRADLARRARFSEEDACRGFCRSVGGVWLDTDLKVVHP